MAQLERLPGEPAFNAAEISTIQLFHEMQAAMSQHISEITSRYEARVAELRRQIEESTANHTAALNQLDDEFFPASRYEGLPANELNERCWAIYINECALHNAIPEPLTVESQRRAKQVFHGEARQAHIIDFLSQPGHREGVIECAVRSIGKYEKAYERKKARRFRSLLGIMGVDVPAEAPAAVAADAARQDNDGDAAAVNKRKRLQY